MSAILKTYRKIIQKQLGEYQHLTKTIKSEKANLADLKQQANAAEEARKIVQQVAQTIQQRAHDRIACIVSRCLKTIFDDESREFSILFEKKRGKTEARLVFLKDGQEIDPLRASGGGAVDVAAFALRLSAILLSRPHQRRLIVLDEPFKFVSAEYRPRVRQMLETLTSELDFQLLMITHMDELECGRVIRLG